MAGVYAEGLRLGSSLTGETEVKVLKQTLSLLGCRLGAIPNYHLTYHP
jgi:hypothetical protein